MALQINLGTFSKIIYLIFLELNQPFTFDECLAAVQSVQPACTKKILRSRIKEMLRKKFLTKHRIKRKNYYNCLINKEDFLAAEAKSAPSCRSKFFLCEL